VKPSNLDLFIAEVTGSGESVYSGVQIQVPFRIHSHLYYKLQALMALSHAHNQARSKLANSRNAFLNDLLQIALDDVYSNISDDDLDQLIHFETQFAIGSLKYLEDDEK
jgi:hypothetical protein